MKKNIFYALFTIAGVISVCYIAKHEKLNILLAGGVVTLLSAWGGLKIISNILNPKRAQRQVAPEVVHKPIKVYNIKIDAFLNAMSELAANTDTTNLMYQQWYHNRVHSEWFNLAAAKEPDYFLKLPVDSDLASDFVDSMAEMFEGLIVYTCANDKVRRELLQASQDFLRAVETKYLELGIDIDDINFASALLFADAMALGSA